MLNTTLRSAGWSPPLFYVESVVCSAVDDEMERIWKKVAVDQSRYYNPTLTDRQKAVTRFLTPPPPLQGS